MQLLSRYGSMTCSLDYLFSSFVPVISKKIIDQFLSFLMLKSHYFCIFSGNCHKECTSRSIVSKGGSATSTLTCKLCLQKRNLMLTSYSTNASYLRHQQKSTGQQQVTAPRIVFKVGSSHSAEPALKVEAQLVTKVKAQPATKIKAQPAAKVEAQPIAKLEVQPLAKVETLPITNVATPNIASVQAQPKTKAKNSKSEKPKKPKKVQAITYFGLVWKKNKTDKDDGSDFRANDIILKSKDGIGSSIKPTCCLCNKTYSPDFLYVRCERCRSKSILHCCSLKYYPSVLSFCFFF